MRSVPVQTTARLSREQVREKLGAEACATLDLLRDRFDAKLEWVVFADGTQLGNVPEPPDPNARRPLPPRIKPGSEDAIVKPLYCDEWLKQWRIAHAKTLSRRDPFRQDVEQRYGKDALR
jgi:hypothetical protein